MSKPNGEQGATLLITSPDALDWELIQPVIRETLNRTSVHVDSWGGDEIDGVLASVAASHRLLDEFPKVLAEVIPPGRMDLRIVVNVGYLLHDEPNYENSFLLRQLARSSVLDDAFAEDRYHYRPIVTDEFMQDVAPPAELLALYEPVTVLIPGIEGKAWLRRWSPKPIPSAILALTVTSDGREVVTGHSDGRVRRWLAATGEPVGSPLFGPTNEITAVGVTADGAWIVAADRDGVLHRWARHGSKRDRKFELADTRIESLALTPDGRYVLAGTNTGVLHVWDPEANVRVRQWSVSQTGAVYALAVSADGTQVVSAGSSGRIRWWRIESGEEIGDALTSNGQSIRAIALSHGDSRLVTGSGDGTVQIWAAADRLLMWTAEINLRVLALAVAESQIVVAGGGLLRQLSVATGEPIGPPLVGHDGDVFAVAVTPDGQQVISGGTDGILRRWDSHTGALRDGPVRSVEQLAEVVSDLESAEDALNIAGDVHTVAAVLAALTTKPPLSVALLGDWGAGKSSFMRQLRNRMEYLARTDRGVFAGNLRQVTFNAWHYSDDHLWVGIVEHLFRSLRAAPAGDTAGLQATLDEEEAEREQLERDLHATERHTLFGVLRSWPVLRAGWRELRRGGWRLWVSLAAVLAGVAVVVYGLPWVGGIVAVLGPLVAGLSGLGQYVETARQQLIARKAQLDLDIQVTSEKLDRLDPARRLDRLLDEITDEDRYAGFRGLTGRIHHDLRRLSDDLGAARNRWEQGGRVGPQPLQRIVLYVDDLDRCAPDRVVDVLQAVNLLLTMDLFMVVVAVDPRWLLRSLQSHHHDTFAEAGPVTYLDKIFHIPFALRPMGDHAVSYLHSLLPPEPEPEPEPPTALPDPDLRPITEPIRPVAPEPTLPVPAPTPTAPPDSTEGLRMTWAERDFLGRLTPLLATPRAIKKLANLYRLLRLSVPRDQLIPFLDGGYQAAALLLAALAGDPSRTRALLIDIMAAETGDLVEVLRGNELGRRLADLLDNDASIHRELASYRRWATEVARYGFETYDLYTK